MGRPLRATLETVRRSTPRSHAAELGIGSVVRAETGAADVAVLVYAAVGIVLAIALVAVLAVVFVHSDRQRHLRDGWVTPPWTGACARALPVDVPLEPAAARKIADSALRTADAKQISRLDYWTFVGWTGLTWR